MSKAWEPTLGAWMEAEGARFRVWAPGATAAEVVADSAHAEVSCFPLLKQADGCFTGLIPDLRAGDRYRFTIDGRGPFPDPASRYQPEGVHGPSQIIDPCAFAWGDQSWRGIAIDDLIVYELHVGTFTSAGTFRSVSERLPDLVELGITAIELMPLADFPGRRNWGYDGVNLFAPAHSYGTPDELRHLVDTAHQLGLAVLLDVVYNHFGPDGNYLSQFTPFYFNEKHHTPWGAALNFDGQNCEPVRAFFLENALHWLHDCHFDGLRFDAAHAIIDEGPRHFLAELSGCVHETITHRKVLLIAEDHRNLVTLISPTADGGLGLDGIWADDFHHQVRRCLARDCEGYYRDYTGSAVDLATTIQNGWFYSGQISVNSGEPRGTDPTGIAPSRFVNCIQNHDQIGNRPFGDRLHHSIDAAAYRAASALLLCAPQTPLLFMGQEWAASAPFQFFTDHNPELGKLVREGRRNEFKAFAAFADPHIRETIPDPQAETTFVASKLDWLERDKEPHAAVLRLYRELLQLRRSELARCSTRHEATALGDGVILLRRQGADASEILIVAALKPALQVTMPIEFDSRWQLLLTTEDERFNAQPRPPMIDRSKPEPSIIFPVPAAVIFRRERNR